MIETQIFEVTVTDSANFTTSQVFRATVTALPPSITSVSPERVRYNGDSMITITGSNFLGTSSVSLTLGGVASFTVKDNNTINATVVGPGRTGVSADLRVTNPGGSFVIPSALLFDGPQIKSAVVSKNIIVKGNKKNLRKKGLIVKGSGLAVGQMVKINNNVTMLVATLDVDGNFVFVGVIKDVIPRKGSFPVSVVDATLNAESNTVQAQNLR